MIDFTTVIGVDSVTIEQLAVTAPAWRKHRPQIWQQPLVAFYDDAMPRAARILEILEHPDAKLICWPQDFLLADQLGRQFYMNQREKMLTGFVHVPPLTVLTQWWLKVDTDAVAMGPADWIPDEWFADKPCFVGSSWGYTKAKGEDCSAAEWALRLDTFGTYAWPDTEPLHWERLADGKRIKHRRMASWVSFYNTARSCLVSAAAKQFLGGFRIVVPSQDTFHQYCADRRGEHYVLTKMKKLKWTNTPNMDKLERLAAEAIG